MPKEVIMSQKKGLFIVIEGTDGAGKATQVALLARRMRDDGLPTETIAFPRYDTPTGKIVKQYLNNEFGPALEIDPRVASKFYADDRLAAADEMYACLHGDPTTGKAPHNLIADRYNKANPAHQGSKIPRAEDRKKFYEWLDDLEFAQNDIPRPDLVIVLHVPAEVSMARVEKRGNAKDGHENLEHLKTTERMYLEIAQLDRETCVVIPCTQIVQSEAGQRHVELTVEEVHERIWATVEDFILRRNA